LIPGRVSRLTAIINTIATRKAQIEKYRNGYSTWNSGSRPGQPQTVCWFNVHSNTDVSEDPVCAQNVLNAMTVTNVRILPRNASAGA
jgi:hypothetical protein